MEFVTRDFMLMLFICSEIEGCSFIIYESLIDPRLYKVDHRCLSLNLLLAHKKSLDSVRDNIESDKIHQMNSKGVKRTLLSRRFFERDLSSTLVGAALIFIGYFTVGERVRFFIHKLCKHCYLLFIYFFLFLICTCHPYL